jgi:DMSO/TMAO reductase YedYZ molybdopterin-dependent catalytic subunit
MRRFMSCMIVCLAILLTTYGTVAQEPLKIAVRGDVAKSGQWSIEDLKKQFSKETQTIKLSQGMEGAQQSGTGIPLFVLIQAAEPKAEKNAKHSDLAFLVYLEARDSYRAFFSLAEISPTVGTTQAWLIWEVNGKPLSGNEAPCRLVVTSDQGHSRSIFGIASVNLVDGTKLANRLPAGQ